MDPVVETTDLSCFNSQELVRAGKVLTAFEQEGADWLVGEVSLCLNVSNRNVYLVDDCDSAAMLDEEGHLRKWWWCSICNTDGFDGEMHVVNGKSQKKEFEKYGGCCSADCQRESEG